MLAYYLHTVLQKLIIRFACAVLFLSCAFFAAGAEGAVSRTITWRNPATYEDNSNIPANLRATIETRLYYSLDRVSWTPFAVVPNGGESWRGVLPVKKGITGYYAATTTIPSAGGESRFSLAVSHTEPVTAASPFPENVFHASFFPTGDTFVGGGGDRNHFGEPLIGTYTWPANMVANRGFLQWDLSAIPPDASIVGATLWLYYVAEEWDGRDDEYTVSVSNVAGVRPDLEHATWNTYDGVSPWTGGSDGGAADIAPAESSTAIGKLHRWVAWDVTEMVGDWVASPEANLGMALDADSIATRDSNRFFASLEYPDPALRPRLGVRYRRPSSLVPPNPELNPKDTNGIGPGMAFASGPAASGFLVSMEPEEDTFLVSAGGSDTNYVTDNAIRTYTWPAGSVANRGFLKWDLSILPDDAVITGATLWLHSEGGGAAQGDPLYWVGVYHVAGVTPDMRQMTWNTFDGSHAWSGGPDGGAGNMSPLGSFAVVGVEPGWIAWNVTELVREGKGAPGAAFVMAVDGDAGASADSCRYFASKDHSDPGLHPRMVVTFTIKPPSPASGGSITKNR